MKHISILVLDDITLTSLDSTRQLFTKVNEFLETKGKQPMFEIELVGRSKETHIHDGLYMIRADRLLSEIEVTDLIIVPQLCGNFPKLVKQNASFVPWIIEKYRNGAEIASLCAGAFLLASTGLLKERPCVVHWGSANVFRKMFPDVQIEDSKIITDDRGIYTSGGNYSYLNLILYLIEKFAGREMCVFVSKMFEIDIERKTQAPFMIFSGQKDHSDEIVRQAQEFIENNYRDKITIEGLASTLLVGRRNLERRFRKVTANTIFEYIQRVKVEAVKKGLETTRKSIIELMMDVDYVDIKSFRDIFKKITGLSPAEYRKRYGMESSALILSHYNPSAVSRSRFEHLP
jgi:transcriptional regulator GlxA family with amidase domain